jgi:hypothetical protein
MRDRTLHNITSDFLTQLQDNRPDIITFYPNPQPLKHIEKHLLDTIDSLRYIYEPAWKITCSFVMSNAARNEYGLYYSFSFERVLP